MENIEIELKHLLKCKIPVLYVSHPYERFYNNPMQSFDFLYFWLEAKNNNYNEETTSYIE